MDSFFVLVVIIWALVVTFHTANLLRERTSVYAIEKGAFQHVDFINIYMAGKLALSEDRYRAYDPEVQLDWYNRVIHPAKIEKCIYLQYPPYFFPLMVPVSVIPLRESYIVWNILSIAFGLACLYLASRTSGQYGKFTLVMLSLGSVISFPSCDSILDGQFTWWLVGGISLFYWGFLRGKDLLCALVLAIMSIKPHFVIFLLIPVLLSKRKRLVAYTALLIAGLLLLSGFVIGWNNLIVYPNILLHAEVTSAYAMVFPERMVSVRGPASVFLPTEAAFAVSFGALAVGLALTVWCWWGCLIRNKFKPEWCMAVTLLALLVTTPHIHVYDCILIALPAFLTVSTVLLTGMLAIRPLPKTLWMLLIASYPVFSWVMMVAVPPLAAAVLPDAIKPRLIVNEIECGLMTYYAYFIFDLVLLILAVFCLKTDRKG